LGVLLLGFAPILWAAGKRAAFDPVPPADGAITPHPCRLQLLARSYQIGLPDAVREFAQ
jgi:hypothetical protein